MKRDYSTDGLTQVLEGVPRPCQNTLWQSLSGGDGTQTRSKPANRTLFTAGRRRPERLVLNPGRNPACLPHADQYGTAYSYTKCSLVLPRMRTRRLFELGAERASPRGPSFEC